MLIASINYKMLDLINITWKLLHYLSNPEKIIEA